MDVTLKNCDVSIRGKLTWNDDIQYWLKNSIRYLISSLPVCERALLIMLIHF